VRKEATDDKQQASALIRVTDTGSPMKTVICDCHGKITSSVRPNQQLLLP
jgi:hypothetical protein